MTLAELVTARVLREQGIEPTPEIFSACLTIFDAAIRAGRTDAYESAARHVEFFGGQRRPPELAYGIRRLVLTDR